MVATEAAAARVCASEQGRTHNITNINGTQSATIEATYLFWKHCPYNDFE